VSDIRRDASTLSIACFNLCIHKRLLSKVTNKHFNFAWYLLIHLHHLHHHHHHHYHHHHHHHHHHTAASPWKWFATRCRPSSVVFCCSCSVGRSGSRCQLDADRWRHSVARRQPQERRIWSPQVGPPPPSLMSMAVRVSQLRSVTYSPSRTLTRAYLCTGRCATFTLRLCLFAMCQTLIFFFFFSFSHWFFFLFFLP
jgi:hypothetical protein